ncbi:MULTISPECIES: HAD family hydrolase [Capnocytophaga]|uniref:HAD-IB family hydrolase n=2 Tax=Capnocytophaga TaxID=1016 RepID=A0A3A1YCC3_9FLAO|nr:HAD-IB family hydrolase [Capnocytophaga canis]RIY35913.1 HAD-IB family hydrolase [Capnocytophaga canis]SMD28986.1 putative hydrolase [Capnocytophaga canimorsus]
MIKVALFDFCETLVSFQTADRFVDFVRKKTKSTRMLFWEYVRFLLVKFRFFRIISIFFPKNNWHKKLKMYQLKGFSQKKLRELSQEYYTLEIRPNLILPIQQELEEKQTQDMNICVVSGGFSIYIEPFCREFGVSKMVATDIGFTQKGRCTGRMKGVDCMHEKKITRLKEILDFSQVDWGSSIAYSDSITDLPLLTIVGEGVVVSRKKSQQWAKQHNLKEIIW